MGRDPYREGKIGKNEITRARTLTEWTLVRLEETFAAEAGEKEMAVEFLVSETI